MDSILKCGSLTSKDIDQPTAPEITWRNDEVYDNVFINRVIVWGPRLSKSNGRVIFNMLIIITLCHVYYGSSFCQPIKS